MAAEAAHIARAHGYAPAPATRQRATRWAELARRKGAGPNDMLGAALSLYWLLSHDPRDDLQVVADIERGFGLA